MEAPPMVDDFLLEVAKPVTIKPAEATQRTTLFLSNIDQEAMYKVDTVYFFGAAAVPSRSNIVNSVVHEALSKILVPYNFIAGRFRANVPEQRVEIDCNDAGVLFTSARSRLKLSDLGDVSVPNPTYRSLLVQPDQSLGLFETPIATFQVTTFIDGGFAFGMSIFHSIMDGTGMTGFLRNLGSLTRDEGLLFVPNPSREFLKARDPPSPDYYEKTACRVFRVSKFSDIPLLPFNPTLADSNSAPDKHVFRSFPFSSQMLKVLKARAVQDGDVSSCSSFEVMTAHVVKEIARARDLEPQLLVSMFMAVNFSRKLGFKIPTNFCCNTVVTACVAATAEELCSKSLGYFTKEVQEALKNTDEEYVKSWTDFWQVNRIGPARIPCGGCISGWWKLPFYDLDFGWGRPIYAGPVPNQLAGFVVLLSNGKHDGGLNLYLSLEPHEMETFQRSIYCVFD